MEALTALRPRLALSILAVAGAAMFLALSPADARAECVSSTPASSVTVDATAPPNVGGPPDIAELHVSLDANCTLTVRPVLVILPLLDHQFLIVSFDLDGDNFEDRWVEVAGVDPFLDDGTPLPFVDSSGFSVTLDELGVTTSPSEIGIAVEGWYDDLTVPADHYIGDYHPDLNLDPSQEWARLPISFTTPPPPQPPAPPAPPPPPAPAATKKATGCVVPKLKGLTVKKAKAALKKAGCKYKLKGKGRVRTFSPKAGTTTDTTVQVKCKSKKRKKKKRSRRSALRVAQYR